MKLVLLALVLTIPGHTVGRRVPEAPAAATAERIVVATLASRTEQRRGVWQTEWTVDEALRGDTTPLVGLLEDAPEPGTQRLVTARQGVDGWLVTSVSDPDAARPRRTAPLPYGWTATPTGPRDLAGAVHAPPAPAGELVFEVAPLLDEDAHLWVRLRNPTDAPLTVDALRSTDGTPRWRDSLVFGVGGHLQRLVPCPDTRRTNDTATVLPPGGELALLVDLDELAFHGKHPRRDRSVTVALGEHTGHAVVAGPGHRKRQRVARQRVARGDCLP
jgi:hypothetical protein